MVRTTELPILSPHTVGVIAGLAHMTCWRLRCPLALTTVRVYADKHSIPLAGVTTRVKLDRSIPDETVFQYEVELHGDLTPEQQDKLMLAASACPAHRALSKKIRFEAGISQPTTV